MGKVFSQLSVLCLAAVSTLAADVYQGTWSGDGLILKLQRQEDSKYKGDLVWDGRRLEIRGQIEDGVFYGMAIDTHQQYSYLIEKVGGRTLRFTINSKPYILESGRQESPAEAVASEPQAKAQPVRPSATRPMRNAAARLILSRVQIDDTGGWVGGTAGSMLAPSDWKTTARVEWFLHPTMPGRIVFESVSPDGRDRIRMYPSRTYFMGPMMVPMREGVDEYYGNIYLRPTGSAQALVSSIFLPGLHPRSRCTQISSQSLPGFAQAIAAINQHPMSTSEADAVRVRVQCGNTVEDLFAVYSIQQVQPASYWQAQYLVSVSSDAAGIDHASAFVAPMLQSLRIDLGWFNKMAQIAEGFQQLQAQNIQLAARQSQIIQSVSDYVSANRRATYENMTRSNSRSMAKFAEHIRGTEVWRNHQGEDVTVPAGYTRGWQSDNGNIVLTNNANLNPNTDSELKGANWHPMQR